MSRKNYATAVLQHGKVGKSHKRPRSWHRGAKQDRLFMAAMGMLPREWRRL